MGTPGECEVSSFFSGMNQRNEDFECKKVDSRTCCMAPKMERFSLDPYIFCKLLKRMCLGNNEAEFCILIYGEIPVVIFCFGKPICLHFASNILVFIIIISLFIPSKKSIYNKI